MAAALVGSKGTVSTGSSGGSVSPSFGAGENRTAGNLLVLWVAGFGTATLPTAPSGWSQVRAQGSGGKCSASVFYKVADGTEASSITVSGVTSTVLSAQLAEFSGTITVAVADRSAGASGTTSPKAATNAAVDKFPKELVIALAAMHNASNATNTGAAHTLNNGASTNSTNNNATSTTNHYDFAHGITTGNGSADSDSYAWVDTVTDDEVNVVVSFKVAVVGATTQATSLTIGSSGIRTAIAAIAQSITDTLAVAGTRTAIAAATRSIVDAIIAAGTRTGIAAAAASIIDTITAAGTRTAIAASDLPLTFTTQANGTRTAIAAVSLPLTDSFTAAGVRVVLGSAQLDEVITFTATGSLTLTGAAALPLTLTIRARGSGAFPPGDVGTLTEPFAGIITETRRGHITHAREGGIA